MKPSLPLLVLFLGACTRSSQHANTTAPAAPDILAAHIDTTVKPGDDFFLYACGRWIKDNPIPASESSWTIGHLVYEDLYRIKRKINDDAIAHAAATGDEKKVGDFWAMAMDSTKADQEGWQPLAAEMKAIDAIQRPADAVAVAAQHASIGGDPFWGFGVGQDQKHSSLITVALEQGGLGLPERDYYFNQEAGIARVRAAYPDHVARMLVLLGRDSVAAKKAGKDVLAFETALAKVSRKLQDLRDPYANYNKMSVAELTTKYTPHIPWRAILNGYGLQACDTVVVGQPEFFAGLDGLLQHTPVNVLQDYLRYHLVSAFAPFLSTPIDRENFAFYGTMLNGSKEQRARWKRALDAEEAAIGMVLGKVYARDYFPERTKQRYDALVEAIRSTYAEHIQALDWMSPATKAKAMEKLHAMAKKVGYPDHWKDYSTLLVGRTSYADNMRNAWRWHFMDQVHKYGKPVDRTEWDMTPQTYNAYYNPSNNEIVLPAGIFLIAGLPDSLADDALVYGYAAASTIGHEITHGFDDEGRQYDAKGDLSEWWTPEDAQGFKARAARIVRQFNGYEPIPGLHVNGDATQGENIADLGGVVLGLDAFKKTEQYKKGEPIAGLTPLQRYFLGYALGWLGHEREERLRDQLLSDVHSPAQFRVNGPFANVPEFYEAFGIKPGDAMWRPDSVRVTIW